MRMGDKVKGREREREASSHNVWSKQEPIEIITSRLTSIFNFDITPQLMPPKMIKIQNSGTNKYLQKV